MKPDELRAKLEGVVAFPVTTFKPDLTLDLKGLRSNVEALVAHSVCAVVAPAGTGELFSLTPAEQMDVFRSTMEVVDGKTPVLIGVGVNQPLAIAAAKEAAAAGASGILAFPPYYPMADARGLVGLLERGIDQVNPFRNFPPPLPALKAWKKHTHTHTTGDGGKR